MTKQPKSRAEKHRAVPDRFEAGWLAKMDTRMALVREMRDRFEAFADDLGGSDSLSYAQRSLVERGLWLEYWLADQERQLVTGAEFDVSRWIQAANSLQGIYSKLGLERRARDVPDLASYLASKEREQ